MSESPLVQLQRQDHVAWLVLNRAEARNALSLETLRQFRRHCAALRQDPEIWAVAITGTGDRAFCAGADLKERRTFTEEQVREFVQQIRGTMDDIAALPQPTLAVLNGAAFGGGCEMALACDLRVMDESASIGLTETSLAIIPGAGGCVRLPRLVGAARAKELILLASRLDAARALEIGLVNFLAAQGQARAKGEEILQTLLRNGPLALQAAKAAVDGAMDLPVEQALAYEFNCYQRIIPTEDRLEALAAFAEKRPPRFQGR
ncbi:MAG: enoyl-CoA hydratase [Planctomycetota bacterium]|nr:MAG: enoyl-CoA hydratase [Planctomycetota bacterium]